MENKRKLVGSSEARVATVCLAIHKVSQKLPKRKRFKVDPIAHMRSNLDKMYKEFKAQ